MDILRLSCRTKPALPSQETTFVLKPNARRRANLAAVLAIMAASCQDASLPTNLSDTPTVNPPSADSYFGSLVCEANVQTREVECGPREVGGGTLPDGVSADRIVGSQGLYTRMA